MIADQKLKSNARETRPSDRITADPEVLGSKPCIAGTRLSVAFLLELIASGASSDQIVQQYPQLSFEDVQATALYAARFQENDILISARVPDIGRS